MDWTQNKPRWNRPIQDKLESIKQLTAPKTEKELKSFLGAIQYLSKYIENLSSHTDFLRQLLKKNNPWDWTNEHSEAFDQIKEKITKIPCLAHYNTSYPNVLTTDASTKGLGATLWQEQPDKTLKPIAFASRFLSDTEKRYAINELELLAVVWGLEHFRLYIYGKPIKLLTDHQALEPLIKRNRSNKTYSARLTRWLDRLAHFDININHIAGKHLALTDYLSRNPVMKAESEDLYDEEYVINNIIPLYWFVAKNGSINDQRRKELDETNQSRKNETKEEQLINTNGVRTNKQANSAHTLRERNSLTPHISINSVANQKSIESKNMQVNSILLEELERTDKSAETQELIRRYKEITKPGGYRRSAGKWKRYHEPKSLRPEKLILEEKLWALIKKESGQTDFNPNDPRDFVGGFIPREYNNPTEQQKRQARDDSSEEEAPSELGVPAINWTKYAGCKTVRYIKMGNAPIVKSPDGQDWKVDQTVRDVEKNFSTDLHLLTKETCNDPTLLKTLVCLERQQPEEIPEDYKIFKNKLSTRFGLVFFEDNIVVPKGLRTTIITLLHKGHPAINKMSLASKGFWWPRIIESIQKKCEECVPCRMSGKNIKPDLPLTEKNKLEDLKEPNEEIQLDFIGPMRNKHQKFYILLAIDRYSKWPTASMCRTPDGRTVIKFIKQLVMVHGTPKTIRTDKGTAFTSKLFQNYCTSKYIKIKYGTPYLHTATGLVERGVRTLKELMLTNLKDNKSMNESLDLALEVMRMTPHTRLKKSAFELHFGRKPNTEINNLLGNNLNKCISAQPDTLQVYSFTNSEITADILPMKQARRTAKDPVSKEYPFQFLEKNHSKGKFDSKYQEKPQTAISGTNHTVTTQDNRIIHRKLISKPLKYFFQDNSKRGKGPRRPDGTFRSTTANEYDNNETEETAKQTSRDKTPERVGTEEILTPNEIKTSPNWGHKSPGIGRARRTLIRNRPKNPFIPEPGCSKAPITRPNFLSREDLNNFITKENDEDGSINLSEILENLDNSRGGEIESEITNEPDININKPKKNNSDSNEIETRIEGIPERRSKRLTKTSPIIRLNNPIITEYRKRDKQHWRNIGEQSRNGRRNGDEPVNGHASPMQPINEEEQNSITESENLNGT